MRVLIATITAGAGHLQAAAALETAWQTLWPTDVVQTVDVLDLVPKLQKKLFSDAYVQLVNHAPELYSLVFKKTDNPRLIRKLGEVRRQLARQAYPKFVRYLKQSQPEMVLCPHFLPLEVLGGMKGKWTSPAPFEVCVVTDFEAHALWIEPGTDLYCVATEETKASLAARGVKPQAIAVTGIPIAAKFTQPLAVDVIRKRLGLREDLPVLLVLGGGFGMGPVAELLKETDQLQQPLQILVVTGKNAELRRELASQDRRHPTDVFGFVTNMPELMAVSDVILTKPGGLTVSEALALGKPLFILNPIPGQESANSDFLLEHGAAVKANRVQDVPHRLGQLLGSDKLREMAQAARLLGKPMAAQAVSVEARRRYETQARAS